MLRNAAQKNGSIPGNAELGGDCLNLLVQLDECLLPKAVILDRLEYSVEAGSNWRKVNIAFEKYLVGVALLLMILNIEVDDVPAFVLVILIIVITSVIGGVVSAIKGK